MPNIAATLSLNVPAITALCKGEPGNTILNGIVPPTGLVGNDGDFYLDTAAAVFYGPKTLGVWGSGIVLNNSALSPNWTSVYTSVRANSGDWESTYGTTYELSARWDNSYTTGQANSARWSSTYTTVRNNSAAFTNVQNNSGNWNSVYTTVYNTSGTWNAGGGGGGAGYDLAVRALTANWESTYSTVFNTSASWGMGGGGGGVDYGVRAVSAAWQNAYTTARAYSGVWWSAYNTATARAIPVHSTVYDTSAFWNNGYSAYWQMLSARTGWDYAAERSPLWDNSYTWIITASQELQDTTLWDEAYTISSTLSTVSAGKWNDVYNATLKGYTESFYLIGNTTGQFLWKYAAYNVAAASLSGWQPRFADVPPSVITNPEGATLTFNSSLSDFNDFLVSIDTSTKPITAVIMPDSRFNVPIGWTVEAFPSGTNKIILSAGQVGATAVTLRLPSGRYSRTQYSRVGFTKIAANTWLAFGDLTTVA
jgi:hypothetical protein